MADVTVDVDRLREELREKVQRGRGVFEA